MKKKVYFRDIKNTITTNDLYLKLSKGERGILFESDEKDTGFTFIGGGPKKVFEDRVTEYVVDGVSYKKDKRFLELIKEALDGVEVENAPKPYVGGAYGNIAYDIIRDYEDLPMENPYDPEVGESVMMIFEKGAVINHDTGEMYLTAIADNEAEGSILLDELEKRLENTIEIKDANITSEEITGNTTQEEFEEMVKKAKEYIIQGDIFQVVLSQRFRVTSSKHPFEIYKRLKEINPSPYMFFLDYGTHQIIGSSPERLVSLQEGIIKTVPIAGTRPRGKNHEEDEQFALDLMADDKEKAEHVMLVDLARNDIGRVSEIGTVKVTEYMEIKKYSHVMHIVSLVEGEVKKGEDAFSVIASVLPAGTLSGAPKIRAMEIIEEFEKERRGFYGGAVGYINFNGDMDTCITIRSLMHKDGEYIYQAGAGIVMDSVPVTEYMECRNKGAAITKIFRGE